MATSANHSDHRRKVGEWLARSYEWRIPVYQRHYAWNPEEEFGPTQLFWEIVKEQAGKRLKNKSVDPHYFGAILVKNKTGNLPNIYKYDVVDGQQRLTTIKVALFAIIGVASKFDYRKEVQDKLAEYIFNDPLPGERKQKKLVPTNFDRTQFDNLLASAYGTPQNERQNGNEKSKQSKVVQAYKFFNEEIQEFVKNNGSTDEMEVMDSLIDTIVNGFELVLIQLKETDEAQKIFESLNNTARPLTTFDLIRNNIFYRADKDVPGSDVELFNSPKWQQFENPFWEATPGRSDKTEHIEAYIGRMLMAKKKKLLPLNRNALFKKYKEFAEEEEQQGLDVKAEIETISEYVDIYKYLVGEEKRNPLGDNFDFGYFKFAICKSMDFYPTVFAIAGCNIPNEEKQKMIDLLESSVIRRHIVQLTAESNNRLAPKICEAFGDRPSYEKLAGFLKVSQESETRAFPKDGEIHSACLNKNFYKSKLKDYIFNKIVHHRTTERDEVRDIKGLTIDHIVPKAWQEKEGWQKALESFDPEDVDIKIHTIGNLTPMSKGLNSQKSNRAWDGDSGARFWLRKCDLKLTRTLADKDKWDIDEIDERSKEFSGIICNIWPEDIK